jgi:hypothetical protein
MTKITHQYEINVCPSCCTGGLEHSATATLPLDIPDATSPSGMRRIVLVVSYYVCPQCEFVNRVYSVIDGSEED